MTSVKPPPDSSFNSYTLVSFYALTRLLAQLTFNASKRKVTASVEAGVLLIKLCILIAETA